MGSFPPGKHFHFGLAGRVLKNLMICHTEAYKLIKSMPGPHCCCTFTRMLKSIPCSPHLSAQSICYTPGCHRVLF